MVSFFADDTMFHYTTQCNDAMSAGQSAELTGKWHVVINMEKSEVTSFTSKKFDFKYQPISMEGPTIAWTKLDARST